jgi:hypothetical protein
MRRSIVVVLSLVLASVGVGCYKFIGFPNYGRPIIIAVVIHKGKGTCTTHTSPQWQPVRRGDKIIWDPALADPCPPPNDVKIQFKDSGVVRFTDSSEVKASSGQKEGEVVGACGRYKYSVLLNGKVVEDPEIEIWP